jgi:hypothetical protein
MLLLKLTSFQAFQKINVAIWQILSSAQVQQGHVGDTF